MAWPLHVNALYLHIICFNRSLKLILLSIWPVFCSTERFQFEPGDCFFIKKAILIIRKFIMTKERRPTMGTSIRYYNYTRLCHYSLSQCEYKLYIYIHTCIYIVHEIRNSIANAIELPLSYINPSIYVWLHVQDISMPEYVVSSSFWLSARLW